MKDVMRVIGEQGRGLNDTISLDDHHEQKTRVAALWKEFILRIVDCSGCNE